MSRPGGDTVDVAPRITSDATLNIEQLRCWADLIADGRDHFPSELSPLDRAWLSAEVRKRRLDRLIQYIARAIAHDLHGAAQTEGELKKC